MIVGEKIASTLICPDWPISQLVTSPVGVEKVFLGNFNSEVRS